MNGLRIVFKVKVYKDKEWHQIWHQLYLARTGQAEILQNTGRDLSFYT